MAAESLLPGQEEHDGRQAAVAFLWVLIAFKVVTTVLIFVHLRTFDTFLFLAATFWYWIPIIGFLVAGPFLFRYRLIRLRARREQLRRSEWMIEPDTSKTAKLTVRPH